MARNNYVYEKTLGVKFPFAPDKRGKLSTLSNTDEVIRQNLINFFKTERNSRVMRPTLGVRLRHRLGDPLTEAVRSDLSESIRDQLSRSFDNLSIEDVRLDQPKEYTFSVNIRYKLKNKINQIDSNEINIIIQ